MLVSVLINPDILELYPTDTVQEALESMDRFRVNHLPVVDQGSLLGVLSRSDLENHSPEKTVDKLSPSFVEARLLAQMHYFECIKLFGKSELSCIPIVDPDGLFIGVVTHKDVTTFLARHTAMADQGAIIVLTMEPKDYSLLQLAQMVEGNDAHIMYCSARPMEGKNELEVTLKVNTTRIGGILQTIHRYGYSVLTTFGESNDTDYLNDRYEALLKYLNM